MPLIPNCVRIFRAALIYRSLLLFVSPPSSSLSLSLSLSLRSAHIGNYFDLAVFRPVTVYFTQAFSPGGFTARVKAPENTVQRRAAMRNKTTRANVYSACTLDLNASRPGRRIAYPQTVPAGTPPPAPPPRPSPPRRRPARFRRADVGAGVY